MIYIAEAINGNEKLYKVGFTKMPPHHRVAQIQSSCPLEVRLVLSFKGDRDLEGYLHGYLNCLRIRGEWFKDGPLIQDIIKGGGFKSLFIENKETREPFSNHDKV